MKTDIGTYKLRNIEGNKWLRGEKTKQIKSDTIYLIIGQNLQYVWCDCTSKEKAQQQPQNISINVNDVAEEYGDVEIEPSENACQMYNPTQKEPIEGHYICIWKKK